MNIQLYINSKDARQTWGLILEDGAFDALFAPVSLKPFIENKSPQEHGKSIYPVGPKVDERDIQLPVIILAGNRSEFYARYSSLVEELKSGVFTLRVVTDFADVTFNLIYLSCQQYTGFDMRAAKLLLRMNEPNPTNRIEL